jgi:hypothetical protein
MMEKRIMREVEKNSSVLAKSRSGPVFERALSDVPAPPAPYPGSGAAQLEAPQYDPEQELTPEQIQVFEKENQDMLKHYESTLDQVRFVPSLFKTADTDTRQDGGKVASRDIRAADPAGEQPRHAIGTY